MFPSGLKSGVEAYNCAVPNTPAMGCTACRLPANSGVEGGLKMLTNMGRSGEEDGGEAAMGDGGASIHVVVGSRQAQAGCLTLPSVPTSEKQGLS